MTPPYVRIAELSPHAGQIVRVRGWVVHLRSSGKVAFIVLRDGSGTLQSVLVKSSLSPEAWERFSQLTQETTIEVTGEVRPDLRAPGGYELGASDLVIHGESPIDYPIQPKEHGIDFLLDNRHFWLRTPRQVAIARVRNEIEQAIHDFFYERGFLRVDTPILTAAIGERSGLFSTEYFDEGNAYLAQTGQLYGEAAAAAFGKIYTFGPTFRAEKSKTRRHLTEFWMIEPEVAFNDSAANMQLQEDLLLHLVAGVDLARAADLLEEQARIGHPVRIHAEGAHADHVEILVADRHRLRRAPLAARLHARAEEVHVRLERRVEQLVGLGAVSTTLIAGVEIARRGLGRPIGSLTQLATIRLGKRSEGRTPKIKDFVPLAGLDDLEFAAWDIFEDNAYEAARTAGVLERIMREVEDFAPSLVFVDSFRSVAQTAKAGNEGVAVVNRARHGDEQIARSHFAAVEGDAGHVEVRAGTAAGGFGDLRAGPKGSHARTPSRSS